MAGDGSILPADRKASLAYPQRDDRIMRVIRLETTTEIRIITAFLDRKARMAK